MATFSELRQWCSSNRTLAVTSGSDAVFFVSFRSTGEHPTAVVARMKLSGVDCVSIRVPLFFSAPVDIPSHLAALYEVSLSGDDHNSPWAAPYGLSLAGGPSVPGMSMGTSLPLAELPRSQFDFALSQILRSSYALYRTLGIDPNR